MPKIYRSFDYSPITQGSLHLIVPWIPNENDPNYRIYGELHSGIDILTGSVHAAVPGVVLQVTQEMDNTWAVSVQYDVNQILRYCNLQDVDVDVGQVVRYEHVIGNCKEILHFEYATLRPSTIPEWNVKLGICTYYKQDPIGVLDGSISFDLDVEKEVTYEVNPNLQTRF